LSDEKSPKMEVCRHGMDCYLTFNYLDAVHHRRMAGDLSLTDTHINYDAYFSSVDGVSTSPYFEKVTPDVVECLN